MPDIEIDIPAADADTGDSTDDTVSDSSAGDTGDSDGGAEPDAGENAEGTDDGITPPVDAPPPDAGDGRTIPAHLKEVLKQHKDLRSMWFANSEYKKIFESPAKAAELVQSLEAIGGMEGIAAERASFAEVDRMFESGDPKALEKWVTTNGDGFAKIMPSALEAYRKQDESGYTHEIAKVMSATLHQSGMAAGLASLKTLVKDNPDGVKLVDSITNFLSGINQLAAEAPKPTVDPARTKLDKDRSDFEKSKSDAFDNEISTGVSQHLNASVKSSLEPYLKGRKLDDASYKLLEGNVNQELSKLLLADATFQAQRVSVIASKDKARIQKFMTANITKHLPTAARLVIRAFGSVVGTGKPPAPKAMVNGSGDPTVTKMNRVPTADEVNWQKTTKDQFFNGTATLVSGKKVSFD
jgi:hypothetical protein